MNRWSELNRKSEPFPSFLFCIVFLHLHGATVQPCNHLAGTCRHLVPGHWEVLEAMWWKNSLPWGDLRRWDSMGQNITGMVGETVKHHWLTVNGWLTVIVIVNSTASVFCITYRRPNSTGLLTWPHRICERDTFGLSNHAIHPYQPHSVTHRRNMDKISSNGVETGHNWTKHWCISSAVTVQRKLGTKHTTL